MSNFVELEATTGKKLVNLDNVIFIEHDNEKFSTIMFSGSKETVVIPNTELGKIIAQIGSHKPTEAFQVPKGYEELWEEGFNDLVDRGFTNKAASELATEILKASIEAVEEVKDGD